MLLGVGAVLNPVDDDLIYHQLQCAHFILGRATQGTGRGYVCLQVDPPPLPTTTPQTLSSTQTLEKEQHCLIQLFFIGIMHKLFVGKFFFLYHVSVVSMTVEV